MQALISLRDHRVVGPWNASLLGIGPTGRTTSDTPASTRHPASLEVAGTWTEASPNRSRTAARSHAPARRRPQPHRHATVKPGEGSLTRSGTDVVQPATPTVCWPRGVRPLSRV